LAGKCFKIAGPFQEVKIMAAKKSRGAAAPAQTSRTIADQTSAYLKGGGKVEEVPRGVSGQTSLAARKHITISSKT
jgi:hypothetical protein